MCVSPSLSLPLVGSENKGMIKLWENPPQPRRPPNTRKSKWFKRVYSKGWIWRISTTMSRFSRIRVKANLRISRNMRTKITHYIAWVRVKATWSRRYRCKDRLWWCRWSSSLRQGRIPLLTFWGSLGPRGLPWHKGVPFNFRERLVINTSPSLSKSLRSPLFNKILLQQDCTPLLRPSTLTRVLQGAWPSSTNSPSS